MSLICTKTCQCIDLGCEMCQATCQVYCQDTCQKSCQNCQGAACQTCQCSSQGCQDRCQKACQCADLGCLVCQDACQLSCQDTCQKSCQSTCQLSCQSTCQLSCQSTCQLSCQNCQGACMTGCQVTCQTGCQVSCQSTCQLSCQCTAQGCQACQAACQLSCQDVCQTACQSVCQNYCQTLAQNPPVVVQPEVVHYGTEGVNTGTGNYSDTFVDMTIDSPGFKLNISRTYNSKDSRDTRPFGRGWTFGFEGYVQGDNPVSVRLPNGGSFMFDKNADGTYTSSDSRNILEKAADGTFTLTTKDQYKYKFNAAKYLASMIDRNNNQIIIDSDSSGKVTAIADTVQRKYTVTYNTDNQIDTITEQATSRRVKYEYANKLLVKVTDPMDHYTTYSYDSYNFLKDIKDQNGNILTSLEYDHTSSDGLHKLTKLTDELGNVKVYTYDITANSTKITDSNGRVTIKWNDSYNYVIKTQDAEGKITTTEYVLVNGVNKYGEELAYTDRNGNKTQYVRDDRGNIIKTINPDTSFVEYTYDDKNNKISEKDELGKLTFYVYDTAKTKVLKKVHPLNGTDTYSNTADQTLFAITAYDYYTDTEAQSLGYKALGLLKSETSPEGNIIIYTYDANGNLATIKDPETLKVKTFEYNTMGLKSAEVTARGFRTEFEYNKNKQLQKMILKNGKNETTVFVYDNRGRKLKEITPNLYNLLDDLGQNNYSGSYGFRFEYYSNGLLYRSTDANNNVTEYAYDLYGNKTKETRPDGSIFEYTYDVMNRIIKISFRDNASTTAVVLEEFFYDILADKRTQKKHRVYLNSTEYAETIEIYDYATRLATITNPEGNVIQTNYNPNGTINNVVDENGKTTYIKYDGLNRLSEKWVPIEDISGLTKYSYTKIEYYKDNNKKAEKVSPDKVDLYAVPSNIIAANYEYYKNENLKKVTDTAGRITESWYDDDGNVSRVEKTIDASKKEITVYENNYFKLPDKKKLYIGTGNIFGNDFNVTGQTELTTSYAYDKNGNLITDTSPDNITTTYIYDNMNRRTTISEPGIDENGTAVTIVKNVSYNYEGKIASVTDQNNNVTNYSYNKRGFLEKVINPDGGVTLYGYDIAGRKTDEVMPNNYDDAKAITQMNRTTYNYDLMNRLIVKSEIFDEKKYDSVLSVWNTTNVTKVYKAFKYDKKGNVIKELDGVSYDSAVGTTTTDKINNGYGIEYKYNLVGNALEVLDPVSKDKGIAYSIKNEYDALGRKVKETDALGRVKLQVYDTAGNITEIKHQDTISSPEVTLESRTYDLHGNTITHTDGNGNVVTFEYNETGKLRKEIHPGDDSIGINIITYQYDVKENLRSSLDSTGRQELITYDNEGRVLTKTEQKSDGTDIITSSIKYDKAGNQRFLIDGNGNIIEKTYDSMNRTRTIIVKVKNVNNIETIQTTTLSYDKNGNKVAETDWRGNIITYVYDGINRLIEKIDPYTKSIEKHEYNKSDVQVKAYDALNNVILFEYDKNNRLIKTTDPEGHSTSQSFDEVGNVKTKTDGRNNVTTYNYDALNRLFSVVNSKSETTSYSYDLLGNILTETDGNGNVTTYEYNVRNKLGKRIDNGGRTGSAGSYVYDNSKVEGYTYFEDEKVKTTLDRNGVTTFFAFDIHDRVLSKIAGTSTVSYTYDKNGNMLTMTDITGVTIKSYDALNRLMEKTQPNIGKNVYEYDIITGVDTGETAEKITDPKGNITLTIFDKLGRIKKVTAEGKTTSYEYFDNSTKKSVQYQDASREDYTYYKNNLLNSLTNKKPDGSVFETFSYSYDGANNQTSKTDRKGTTSYTYDALNRLETVTEPGNVITSYIFDRVGNRTTEIKTISGVSTTTTHSYNDQNRLTGTVTTGGTTENVIYTYDNNGNLIKEDNGTSITSYVYDEFSQMKERTSGSTTLRSKYDGTGLRVEKEVNGVKSRFQYDGDRIILEVSDAGTELARNIYGTNLIQRKASGKIMEYFYNGNSDVTALIDDTGAVAATYYFDAFGNIQEETGASSNPYKYRGYEQDKESGHYYLKARYYNPKIARFISEDSYRGNIHDPLSLNLYTYCHNEPIMYVDPEGHKEIVADDGAGNVITYNRTSYTQTKTSSHETGKVVDSHGNTIESIDITKTISKNATTVTSIVTDGKTNQVSEVIGVVVPVNGKAPAVTLITGSEPPMPSPSSNSKPKETNSVADNNPRPVIVRNYQINYNNFKFTAEDKKLFNNVLSTIAGAIPVVGDIKDIQEVLTGVDLITGEKLSASDRAITLVSSVIPGISGKALRMVEKKAAKKAVITLEKKAAVVENHVVSKIVKDIKSATKVGEKGKYVVGAYKDIKGVEGLDAHHVGQKSKMKELVKNYDPQTAPAINVPKVGHTISGPKGVVSRNTKGVNDARQLLARDIKELKRVYEDIPNSALKELIDLNKKMYPEMRKK